MDDGTGEENETSTTRTTSTSSSSGTDLVGPGGYPGDGVCPSVASLQAVFRSAYDSWATPKNQMSSKLRDELFDMNMLLQLMTKFPPFRPRPLKEIIAPEATTTTTPSDLMADLVMSLETCMLPECTQREKRIPYHLVIGCSNWNTYDVVHSQDHEKLSQLGGLPLHLLQHFTRLVLAWSYVLCCHWVEILQGCGENVAILRPETSAADNFWEMIRGEQWQATVTYDKKIYYAPFMLRSSSLDLGVEMLVVLPPSPYESRLEI